MNVYNVKETREDMKKSENSSLVKEKLDINIRNVVKR